MRSSFMGFEVSKRSIQMAQKSLDITNNNMSNMKTEGFTRQRVDVNALYMNSSQYWQTPLSKLSLAGQGVNAFGVSQIRNSYLDKRYRDMTCFAAEYDTKIKIGLEVETALDCIDTFGLYNAFTEKLKPALEQVSLSAPDARDMCSLVRNEAVNICAMLRTYAAELDRLLENNVEEMKTSINNANIIIDKIVDYNKKITDEYASHDWGRMTSGQGVSEYGPLELIDKRNLLLDELSAYGNIHVTQNVNGSVTVTMGDATIIDDQKSEKIVMKEYKDYNAAVLTLSNGTEFHLNSGEIKGFYDMVNGNGPYSVGKFQNGEYGIPYYKNALDTFAAEFADLMNNVNHADNYEAYTWNRSLIWGGNEYDEKGNTLYEPLRDANGNTLTTTFDVFDIDATSFAPLAFPIGSTSIDITFGGANYNVVFDGTQGDLVAQITALNINGLNVASDTMTGITFRAVPNTVALSVTSSDPNLAPLINSTPTTEDISVPIRKAVNASNIKVSDEWMKSELMIGETFNPDTLTWQVNNLDGSNLSRFVNALETKRSWGRANDLMSGTAFDYLQFLSNRIGQSGNFLENQFDMVMDTVTMLTDARDSISGVSDTEEGINLMTYQKWYNASARIMTTLDEALDTLINRTGRVGL